MALEIATTQEQSAEQDLAEQRQILHKVAQGVGEAAALNFRRAFCVAKARLIMGHVGVTRVDTGESIGRRIWQNLAGQPPQHVQTEPILYGAKDQDAPMHRWVLGEYQTRDAPNEPFSNKLYSVVYLRPLMHPKDYKVMFADYDLAISDEPFWVNRQGWDLRGGSLNGKTRPLGGGDYIDAFSRTMDGMAEAQDIELPDASRFKYDYLGVPYRQA